MDTNKLIQSGLLAMLSEDNASMAAEQEPYYVVGRRPLGKSNGLGNIFYNAPDKQGNAGWDWNLRAEHQHFLGSDGSNFGLDSDGVFSEPPERLKEYETTVPGIEGRKMKGKYIDSARKKVEQHWLDIERKLQDANRSTPFHKGMRQELNRYHLFGYNCQSYVDDVISEAEKEARRNGESLYLD